MRTKTKSFFEDLFVIFIIGLIIYGIYNFFFSSDENELKFEEIKSSIEKKIENEIFVKSPISEEKSNEKVEEEKVEETINQTQKEESLTSTTISDDRINRMETIERVEQNIEEKTPIKEEMKTNEKEVISETQTSTQLDDKARIELFYEQIRAQINSNIEKNVDKNLLKDKEAINIRLTVLRDGRYEQITLMEGNKETFENIRPSITKAFPIKIDDSLKASFPRYFRMKIEF